MVRRLRKLGLRWGNLTLRQKTILISAATVLGLIAIAIVVSQTILMASYAKLEKQYTAKDVERALHLLQEEVAGLATVTNDWATWDDTYRFIEEPYDEYVRANLVDTTMAGLGLNVLLFVKPSGQLVESRAFDTELGQAIPVPQSLLQHISADSPLVLHPDEESSVSGIILLPEGPLLFASEPILTGKGEGPVRGALLMGRYLDSGVVTRLAEVARMPIAVQRLDGPGIPDDFEQAYSSLSADHPILVRPLDKTTVAGYGLIQDIYGQPVLMLRVDSPRSLYHQGQTSAMYIMAFLGSGMILLGILSLLLMQRTVVSPLTRLNAAVETIGSSGNLDVKVEATAGGKDELSTLAATINRMLQALSRSQDELRRSEGHFRALIDNCFDGIVVLNCDGTVRYESASFQRILGYEPQERIGESAFEFVHPDDLSKVTEEFTRLVQTPGMLLHSEVRAKHRDGSWRYLEVVGSNLTQDPAVHGIVANFRDITERKRLEETTLHSLALAKSTLEGMPDGVILVDMQGKVTYVNNAFESLLGYSARELVGTSALDLPTYREQSDKDKAREALLRVVRGEKVESVDMLALRKDGTETPIAFTASVITDAEGKPQTLVAVVRDVSARKQAEAITRLERDLASGLNAASDLESALNLALEIALETSGMDCACAYLVNESNGDLKLAVQGRLCSDAIEHTSCYPSHSAFARLMMQGKPVYAEHLSPSVDNSAIPQSDGLKAVAIVPILEQDRIAGCLQVGSHTRSQVPAHARKALDAIAVQLSSALVRFKAQEELKRREEHFRALIENSSDGIVILDSNGRVRYESPSFERLLGHIPETRLGQSSFDFVHPDDLPQVVHDFRRLVQTPGMVLHSEVRAKHIDGSWRVLEVVARNLINDAAVGGIVANVRDITERKRMTETIERQMWSQRAIAVISSRFVSAADIDAAISASLADMGRLTNASRCYLFLLSTDGKTMDNTHEWCAEGVRPEINNLKGLPVSGFPWWMAKLRDGETIHISDVSLMPPEAQAEKEILESQGIKSLLVLPLIVGRELAGFLGFDNVETVGTWSEESASFLRVCSEIIGSALERRRMEEALRISEERYRHLVSQARDIVFRWSVNNGLEYVSPAVYKITGYTVEELMTLPMMGLELAKGSDLQLGKDYTGLIAGGTLSPNREVPFVRKDGKQIYLDMRAQAVTNEKDEVVAIEGILRDITERKEMQEALKRSEEKLRRYLESSPDGIYINDVKGNFIYGNRAAERLIGYAREELLGKSFLELGVLPPEYVLKAARLLELNAAGKPTGPDEFELIRKDGSRVWVEISTYPIGQGNNTEVIGIARDITERKRMEQQLQLAGRLAAVGELAAGVAHELNNPLTAIQGFAQLLTSRKDLDEVTRKDVDIIYREALRASKITKNLLSFARRHEPEKRLISINEVVEKTLGLRQHQMKVNNIELATELQPDLPDTMADFYQMQQVFMNIVVNAEQAMSDANGGGKLVVRTQELDNFIQVSFADNGPGISEENLKRIFDPFFTTKDVGKGTGLGLSISYGIVQAHGGRIYARSKPGEGATFFVEIPIVGDAVKEQGGA
jgi:two-component system cell cycle sensor histidine kinase/response regulator CckA